MPFIHNLGLLHDEVFQEEIAHHIPYHRMYGKQYCVPSLTVLHPEEEARIQRAAEQIDQIYWKVLRFTQRYMPDSFLIKQLGLHPALIPAARIEVPYHGLSRQDWIMYNDELHCIENNTDTPSGVPETAYLANELIAGLQHYRSSSVAMRSTIQQAFDRLIRYYRGAGLHGKIACTSYGWHLEDKVNTEYVLHAIQELGYDAIFVPLEELEIIPNDGLYANGERISILYRLYPLEYLVYDTDEETGEQVGLDLLELVVQGQLGLINPAQSCITQSKGFMALIWSLYERREQVKEYLGEDLYDPEDIQAIENHLLPTYYEDSVFQINQTPFVAKGYWGREGKGTSLYNEHGSLEHIEYGRNETEMEDVQQYYDKQPKIYQQRCLMQPVQVETEEGIYNGYLLIGAYMIGGTYSGLLPRVGGMITGDMAYYCPAAIID